MRCPKYENLWGTYLDALREWNTANETPSLSVYSAGLRRRATVLKGSARLVPWRISGDACFAQIAGPQTAPAVDFKAHTVCMKCPEYEKLRKEYFEAARKFQLVYSEPLARAEFIQAVALRNSTKERALAHKQKCLLVQISRPRRRRNPGVDSHHGAPQRLASVQSGRQEDLPRGERSWQVRFDDGRIEEGEGQMFFPRTKLLPVSSISAWRYIKTGPLL